jgi:hypothetical protein
VSIAIICGGGEGVWDEASEVLELCEAAGVEVVRIAVNDAGITHPDPLDHWASLHPDKLHRAPWEWRAKRAALGLVAAGTVWSCTRVPGVVDRIIRAWSGGSSGWLAVGVATAGLGIPAILCGVPMDERRNEFTGKPWAKCEDHRYPWTKWRSRYAERTRSMSGWTREQLGHPDVAWLSSVAGTTQATEAR